MEQRICSVNEVNQIIKLLLDNEPLLQNLYVRGELSNFKRYPSGHCYFTLKDKNSTLRCVMFKAYAAKIRFHPSNGMSVIVHGRISVFSRDGAYQFYCDSITPEGAGDLAVAFEQMKAKLYNEGLFDPKHKKPLPPYPETIVIVTSEAGAAVHDMIRILRARYPIAAVRLLPVRVQGEEAPAEIAEAIQCANQYRLGDVIITGRGGGSMEDLWAFNDERVARAIYDSDIPVISAVGHEPDVTIADFVADVRASTPSNAAEIAVPDQGDLLRWLQGAALQLAQSESERIAAQRRRLDALTSRRVLTDQTAYLQDRKMELAHIQRRLSDVSSRLLSRKRQKFAALTAALDAMSPLKVLNRGYAIVQNQDGQILKDTRGLSIGDPVSIHLGQGGFTATVDHVHLGYNMEGLE